MCTVRRAGRPKDGTPLAPPPPQGTAAVDSGEPQPAARLLVQGQDAGNAVEYLPPAYQEAWQLDTLSGTDTPLHTDGSGRYTTPDVFSPPSIRPDCSNGMLVGPAPVPATPSSGNSASG